MDAPCKYVTITPLTTHPIDAPFVGRRQFTELSNLFARLSIIDKGLETQQSNVNRASTSVFKNDPYQSKMAFL